MKSEASPEKTPEPSAEEQEEWSQSPAYLDSQNQDPEYLESMKQMRQKLEQMWTENPDSRPNFGNLMKIVADE